MTTLSAQLLTDFKAYRQLSGTSNDARISFLIAGVLAKAERYLGRSLSSSETTEDHDWISGGVYFLRRSPVDTEADFAVSLVDFSGNETELSSDYYRYDAETGELHLLADSPLSWAFWGLGVDSLDVHSSFRAVRFTYSGGYDSTNAPSDLRLALCQMIDDLYTSNEFGQGVSREITGGQVGEVKYQWKSEDEMRALLRRYLLPFKTGGVR